MQIFSRVNTLNEHFHEDCFDNPQEGIMPLKIIQAVTEDIY